MPHAKHLVLRFKCDNIDVSGTALLPCTRNVFSTLSFIDSFKVKRMTLEKYSLRFVTSVGAYAAPTEQVLFMDVKINGQLLRAEQPNIDRDNVTASLHGLPITYNSATTLVTTDPYLIYESSDERPISEIGVSFYAGSGNSQTLGLADVVFWIEIE
jgi:hypothetical protein